MKRYKLGNEPFQWPVDDAIYIEHPDGNWVQYTDVKELQEKLKMVTELLENMSSAFANINDDIYDILKRLRK